MLKVLLLTLEVENVVSLGDEQSAKLSYFKLIGKILMQCCCRRVIRSPLAVRHARHGTYFLRIINPKIKIDKKYTDTHEYIQYLW